MDTGTGGSAGGGGGRPATMQDIAAATGVSRSTVSRILNDAPLTVPIAQETRERVLATAHDLGYLPNPRRKHSATDR